MNWIDLNTVERAKQLAAECNMTLYKLAGQSGVSYNTIKNVENRGGQINVDMIYRICNYLLITASQFFDPEFHLEPRESAGNWEE